MKGYASRESARPDSVTLGEGRTSLQTAIEEVRMLGAVGAALKRKFLRLPQGHYGVNWASINEKEEILSLIHVEALPVKLEGLTSVQVPAWPFLKIPDIMRKFKLGVIIKFEDCVAAAAVTPDAIVGWRLGYVSGVDTVQQPVVQLTPSEFKKIDIGS